ncbi:uncharacterized protein TNCV_2873981 [Trichonephila clavipes]|nr:uncharacterized protein TNCV_2873981 [Trichonephila clavipes]
MMNQRFTSLDIHNARIWSLENPNQVLELQRESPKLNVFCSTSRQKVYGPFLCREPTVAGSAYLDTLQLWLFPQSKESEPDNFIWQEDGAPPHWHLSVRDWLNITVPNQWICRKRLHDKACSSKHILYLDLTPCDFYLWWFIKDCVYISLLPENFLTFQTYGTGLKQMLQELLRTS